MAEFKKVFNFVSEEVISQGYSFEDFINWLATRKESGKALESWTKEDIAPQVAMWKAMKIVEGNKPELGQAAHFQASPSRNSLEDGDIEDDFVLPAEGFQENQGIDFDGNPLRLVVFYD